VKRFILLYPPGGHADAAPLARLLADANPEAKVSRRLSPNAKSVSLLVIDRRHGNQTNGV
jgi:hypothetical protein